ncbi:hypothetical protein FPQ18DRAFT_338698, partial [Pyronema domesticum]
MWFIGIFLAIFLVALKLSTFDDFHDVVFQAILEFLRRCWVLGWARWDMMGRDWKFGPSGQNGDGDGDGANGGMEMRLLGIRRVEN